MLPPPHLSVILTQIKEFSVDVTHPSGLHQIGYSAALRSVSPLRHPTDVFRSACSSQVAAHCTTSLKSALTYAFVMNRFAPSATSRAPSGFKTMFQVELAGALLGGDSSHLKLGASHAHSWSWARYAPDTGFAHPPSAAAYQRAVAELSHAEAREGRLLPGRMPSATSDAPAPSLFDVGVGPDGAPLRHSPVTLRIFPHLRHRVGAACGEAAPYSLESRAAAWAAPGVTLAVDVAGGALLPLPSPSSPGGRAGVEHPSILDRLFLDGNRMRGFDGVGPRAAPVPAGTLHGDALGGEVLLHASARILLPPPLPSVRAANAGLRTQLWATAASLRPSTQATDLFARPAVAAGVGVVMPLASGIGLEANYSLFHVNADPGDLRASLRMQLLM